MANRSLEARNPDLPLFTQSLLACLPEEIPHRDFRHTNMADLSGRDPLTLSPREAEKAIMYLSEFEQERAFTKREAGFVSIKKTGEPSILLEDRKTRTCFDGQCFIENVIAKGKYQLGMRITPLNQDEAPEIPFIRFDTLDHCRLVKNDDNAIIGIKIRKHTNGDSTPTYDQYILQAGDRVELFLDPKSISKPMFNPEADQQKVENTILGGGFSVQISGYDPTTKSFMLKADWVGNDINIRNIYDPTSEPFRLDMLVNVGIENGEFVLPDSYGVSLNNAIRSNNLKLFAEYTVAKFIRSNSRALYTIFGLALQLDPDVINTHGVKCQFATIGQDKPQVKTYAFDFESGDKEAAKWKPDTTPHFHYWPHNNPRLRQVLTDFTWEQPNLYKRFIAAQLARHGIINESLESTTELLTAAQTKRDHDHLSWQHPITDKTISDSIDRHIHEPSEWLVKINQELPNTLKIDESTYTAAHSIERLLGEVLPKIMSKKVWDAGQVFGTNIHQISFNDNLSVLHVDINGFKLAYLIRNGQVDPLHSKSEIVESSTTILSDLLKEISQDSRIPLVIVPAVLHSLREGD